MNTTTQLNASFAEDLDDNDFVANQHALYDDADTSTGIMLYMEEVDVFFDAFQALNKLTLYIGVGELRCIIGPNGAGKTTLMDVITGKTRPTTGSVFLGQQYNLAQMSIEDIAQAGIGRKFQKPTVFEEFSLYDNLLLAASANKQVRFSLNNKISSQQKDELEQILERIQLQDYVHKQAGLLSHGQKQWLEIGMLLMQKPKLVLLDEPVAGMTEGETDRTAELCLDLKKDHTLVVIEHDMSFIDKISETVSVLAQGSVIAEGTLDQVKQHPQVIEKYLGR